MGLSELDKKLNKIFGIVDLDIVGKRKIHKPNFTSALGNEAEAQELVRLAEEAVASKGKVFAKKGNSKEYVCWCAVRLADDGTEGKKKLRHYEATYYGAAAGCEDMLPQFIKDVTMIINHEMITWEKAQYFELNGEITEPDPDKEYGEKGSSQRYLFALAMAIIFGSLMHSWLWAIIMFSLYSSIDYGSEKVKIVKSLKKEKETEKPAEKSTV